MSCRVIQQWWRRQWYRATQIRATALRQVLLRTINPVHSVSDRELVAPFERGRFSPCAGSALPCMSGQMAQWTR